MGEKKYLRLRGDIEKGKKKGFILRGGQSGLHLSLREYHKTIQFYMIEVSIQQVSVKHLWILLSFV